MTPAETIRAAVAKMRADADAATPGPWWSDESDDTWRLHGTAGLASLQILKAPKHGTPYAEYWPKPADAAHITSWHPLVTRAVADLLEEEAPRFEQLDAATQEWLADAAGGDPDPALVLARLYLGEGS